MRLSAIFVAVCMTLIAASAGSVVYYAYGFSAADAIVVAIVALTALALYNAQSTRMDMRSVVGPQLTELSRMNANLARQLAEIGRRLAAVEAKQERTLAKNEAKLEPLAVEISELGSLVDQLAKTVSIHETQLGELARSKLERAAVAPARVDPVKREAAPVEAAPIAAAKPESLLPELVNPEPANTNSACADAAKAELAPLGPNGEPNAAWLRFLLEGAAGSAPVSPPPISSVTAAPAPAPAQTVPPPAIPPVLPPAASETPPAASLAQEAERQKAERTAAREMPAATRSAVEANRIDLHLQPIVTLPQRKVRFYEAMSRLRTENGEVMLAADFISHAEAAGLMPKIDNLVVFRCVQVLRRLLLKNREVGVFCNLSMATLTDAVVFPQLLEFLDANRAIAGSLMLEFTQGGLRSAGPIQTESLAALRACGYHFSMDNVTDLRLEPRELAARGFRCIKLRANLILNRSGIAADIHPGDLPALLSRFGIDLIAERIESEGTVVDLLDCDVKFGQGFLFSPPRPVRAEALAGVADRNDVVARDSASEAGAPAGPDKEPSGPGGAKGLRPAGLARVARHG